MKPLIRVSASDVPGLTRALAAALEGGPAIWPVPGDPSAIGEQRGAGTVAEVDDRIALVVETSGSTDAPKRVLLSADALAASADATHDALGGQGRWLLALPGHYIAGAQVLVRSILAGTEPVVIGGGGAGGGAGGTGTGGFDVREFAEASATLDARTPRYTSLVPVQLARLVEAAERDAFVAAALTGYDAILVGGQALAAPVAERAAALGARIVRTYGSSETSGGCVYDGVPLPGVEVRVLPSTSSGSGEVLLSGPMLADGYLDDPERTARAFETRSGRRWYRTGDLGGLGEDGRLRIRGRADDVIISGGVKVSLGEIERAVRALDGFHDAVAVAVDDPEWGQRAAIVTAEASHASATSGAPDATLDALARATDAAGLPPAGRPVRLVVLDELPLLASGKPDRVAISRRAAASASI